jgi:hypothetical protein
VAAVVRAMELTGGGTVGFRVAVDFFFCVSGFGGDWTSG